MFTRMGWETGWEEGIRVQWAWGMQACSGMVRLWKASTPEAAEHSFPHSTSPLFSTHCSSLKSWGWGALAGADGPTQLPTSPTRVLSAAAGGQGLHFGARGGIGLPWASIVPGIPMPMHR